jgi:hypothetical protein
MWRVVLGASAGVAASLALGLLLLQAAHLPFRRGERWPVALGLGAAAMNLLFWLLGWLHQARRGAFLSTAVALTAAALWRVRRAAAAPPVDRRYGALLVFLLLPYAGLALTHALAPEVSLPGSGSLAGTVAWLNRQRGYPLLPEFLEVRPVYSAAPLLQAAYSIGELRAAALLNCAFLLALPWFTFCYARRWLSGGPLADARGSVPNRSSNQSRDRQGAVSIALRAGALAAVLVLASPAMLSAGARVRGEVLAAYWGLTALALLRAGWEAGLRKQALAAAALALAPVVAHPVVADLRTLGFVYWLAPLGLWALTLREGRWLVAGSALASPPVWALALGAAFARSPLVVPLLIAFALGAASIGPGRLTGYPLQAVSGREPPGQYLHQRLTGWVATQMLVREGLPGRRFYCPSRLPEAYLPVPVWGNPAGATHLILLDGDPLAAPWLPRVDGVRPMAEWANAKLYDLREVRP